MKTREVTARKIRNGLRKQAEKILREKMKMWEILKRDSDPKEIPWSGITSAYRDNFIQACLSSSNKIIFTGDSTV